MVMRIFRFSTAIGGITLASLGVFMALTNPSQKAYEEYAMEELTTYLKDEVCTQVPSLLGDFLQQQCKILVDTGRPQIQQIIAETTERQNFLVFSIYRTHLSVNSDLPSYEFETVGVVQSFYIYMYEEL